MKAFATLSKWIDMNGHTAKMGQVVKELMAFLLGDRVSLGHGELSRYAHAHVGMQAMADPSSPHIGDLLDPVDMCRRVGDSVHGSHVDSVQHPEDDRAR